MKKTLVFGGSFDPVHIGHLSLARTILRMGKAHQVLFVPVSVLPHTYKTWENVTAFSHRCAMLERAIAGEEGFYLSDMEHRREGKSYTVDTLRILRSEGVWGELTLLMGADSLAKLHTWKEAHALVEEFSLTVYPRKGVCVTREMLSAYWSEAEQDKLLSSFLEEVEEFDISSTRVREICKKKAYSELFPFVKEGVLRYIIQEQLYM